MKTLSKILVAFCFFATNQFALGQSIPDVNFKRFILQGYHTEGGFRVYELIIDVPANEYYNYISSVKIDSYGNNHIDSDQRHPDFKAEVEFLDSNLNPISKIKFDAKMDQFGDFDIVGPEKIKIRSELQEKRHYNGELIAPAQIINFGVVRLKANNASAPNPLPSNTVVIPTDASGPVEIIMKSSKDLVNWTRAEPGSYGADTPKRFFRIRAVVKP